MLDDFRKDAGEGSLFGDDDVPLTFDEMGAFNEEYEDFDDEASKPVQKRKGKPQFLGMTAFQRLFLSAMLFGLSCVLSAMCLVLTNKVMF